MAKQLGILEKFLQVDRLLGGHNNVMHIDGCLPAAIERFDQPLEQQQR
jgi:hypothetical protein